MHVAWGLGDSASAVGINATQAANTGSGDTMSTLGRVIAKVDPEHPHLPLSPSGLNGYGKGELTGRGDRSTPAPVRRPGATRATAA